MSKINYAGKTRTIRGWAKELGTNPQGIYRRWARYQRYRDLSIYEVLHGVYDKPVGRPPRPERLFDLADVADDIGRRMITEVGRAMTLAWQDAHQELLQQTITHILEENGLCLTQVQAHKLAEWFEVDVKSLPATATPLTLEGQLADPLPIYPPPFSYDCIDPLPADFLMLFAGPMPEADLQPEEQNQGRALSPEVLAPFGLLDCEFGQPEFSPRLVWDPKSWGPPAQASHLNGSRGVPQCGLEPWLLQNEFRERWAVSVDGVESLEKALKHPRLGPLYFIRHSGEQGWYWDRCGLQDANVYDPSVYHWLLMQVDEPQMEEWRRLARDSAHPNALHVPLAVSLDYGVDMGSALEVVLGHGTGWTVRDWVRAWMAYRKVWWNRPMLRLELEMVIMQLLMELTTKAWVLDPRAWMLHETPIWRPHGYDYPQLLDGNTPIDMEYWSDWFN
jgi:hypothetical protein